MNIDLVFAGFGGQGVLLAGDLLAFSYMRKDYEVSWFPSYGVEMRGGAANCTVIISSNNIGSPLTERPGAAVCLSSPALDKFQGKVVPEGLLIVNSSMVQSSNEMRSDLQIIELSANDIALKELGELRMANMIMLGALVSASKELDLEAVQEALPYYFQGKENLIPAIKKSLIIGGKQAS